MATNVVVIDSTARRATVKTTPGTYLSDVLSQACTKLGANSSQYGLKHNNKQVDLSRTIRLSGLSSGAKLELVQLSKSAGVVSVALQLPESETQTSAQARLTDKFPSTTTLWLLLRKFEAGVAGSPTKRNFTARGAPSAASGAGRLYYEQPVLNIMGRELSGFTDLQKTLAMLGFNSGSVLIKLTFKTSETPLEEAMAQIQQYFDQVDPQAEVVESSPSLSEVQPVKELIKPEWLEDQDQQMQDVQPSSSTTAQETTQPQPLAPETQSTAAQPSTSSEPSATVSNRPVSVYRPPTSSAPPTITHNDSDYVPTVEHAQIHQRLLQQESRNKRLPTDAELLAKQKEQKEELQKIESVEIKIRFPDQSAISSKFGQHDTAATLYQFVRDCLDQSVKDEVFVLRNPGIRGKGEVVLDNDKKLIVDLQLRGRVLVVFGWDENKTSADARATKQVLKAELRQQAKDYVAPSLSTTDTSGTDEKDIKVDLAPKKEDADGGSAKGKMPKWLKGLGKK